MPIKNDTFDFLESKFLPWALFFAVLLSIANHIWHFLGKQWEISLILFGIFLLLQRINKAKCPVEYTHFSSKNSISIASIQYFDNNVDFYKKLLEVVKSAEKKIFVTYERLCPPSKKINEENEYFDAIFEWARKKTPGAVTMQRIIRIPEGNKDLELWAHDQIKLSQTTKNYRVAISKAEKNVPEGISFAVIDGAIVFVAFFMDNYSELHSHCIHDFHIASDYEAYFKMLWGSLYKSTASD
jgi:hypothetical protein